ncbi:MAG TPA: NUDIX hydrolase [Actinomycetes bacterium]|nr:NUDIX hydrolase [Actinomycetes bacterium]
MDDEASSIADRPGSRDVLERRMRIQGAKWDVVTDRVQLDDDTVVDRDVVLHPGAVGIVALDDDECVTLICQYRHPVAADLWEIPAGLLDEPGESPWSTAQRELLEEVGLSASTWHTLIDLYSSPGMSSEAVRVYLARGLTEVDPGLRPEPTDEERDLIVRRIPLDAALERVLNGHIHNSLAVTGLLATAEARRLRWEPLRIPDAEWPAPSWEVL